MESFDAPTPRRVRRLARSWRRRWVAMKNIAETSCTCKGGQRRGGGRHDGQGERQDHGGEAQGGRGEGGDCLMLRIS